MGKEISKDFIMKIHQFMRSAFQGGYKFQHSDRTSIEEAVVYAVLEPSYTLLDPLAWKAVGNVDGWGESYFHIKAKSTDYESFTYDECWKMNMHRFVGFLCDGLTLEEALDRATS